MGKNNLSDDQKVEVLTDQQINMMFVDAEGFYEAAYYLSEKMDTYIPVIVNAIFACELYLKYLLVCINNGRLVRGHDINSLINNLPDALRDKLSKSTKCYANMFADGFVNYRYPYEKTIRPFIQVDLFWDFINDIRDLAKNTSN